MSSMPMSGRHFLVVNALCAVSITARSGAGTAEFRVRIPEEVPTENLTISCGLYGRGLLREEIRGRKGLREYAVPIRSRVSIRLFAYCPGYQIAHISDPALDEPWAPRFKALASTRMEGKLTDTKGNPLAEERVVLTYHALEAMPFFGYRDGSVPILAVASAETKQDGTFHMEVPLLQEDPFFREHPTGDRSFHLALDRIGTRATAPWILRPATIPVQSRYDDPLTLQVVEKGKVTGRIGEVFLKENDVRGEVRNGFWPETETGCRIDLQANARNGNVSYNCMLRKDHTFSVLLPPGEYDLCLRSMKRGYVLHRQVTVREDIMVREADDVRVVLE